jgi:hypothetical protein
MLYRLERLEEASAPRQALVVWGGDKSEAEVEREIADLVACGRAAVRDEFYVVRWLSESEMPA